MIREATVEDDAEQFPAGLKFPVGLKLSDAQRDGRACLHCAGVGGPMLPMGWCERTQVFAHETECAAAIRVRAAERARIVEWLRAEATMARSRAQHASIDVVQLRAGADALTYAARELERGAASVLLALVLVAGCAESHAPTPAPSCSTSGPMLSPDEQRPILGAVFVIEDDGGGDVCALGAFNDLAPESFVRDCAAYAAEATTCDELRARAEECRSIGLGCGIFAEVGP